MKVDVLNVVFALTLCVLYVVEKEHTASGQGKYRVFLLTGTPPKVRLHSKSHQKVLSVRIYLPAGT